MKYEQVVTIMHLPVLPTWSVLLTDKLYKHVLDGAEHLLFVPVRFGSACGLRTGHHLVVPVHTGNTLCLRHGHHLQHVDGAGPVAGPVGAQHGLGLITEDGQQAAAAGLTVEGWMLGINIRYVWKGPTGHSRDNISQFRKNW